MNVSDVQVLEEDGFSVSQQKSQSEQQQDRETANLNDDSRFASQ